MRDLSGLFSPARVAVVGADDDEGSVGRSLMENLLADFRGDVVPVNPNLESVLGVECYPDIGAVPDPVDLAVVAVPARVALEVLRQVGEAGVRNVVVVTAGFAEAGEAGAERQAAVVEIAEDYDLNLVGPNSLGVISTPVGLNATFAEENALPGSISVMSQSGAFVTAVLDWAATRGVGFKDVVSLGNEAVLSEVDFVEAWGDDPDTDVVLGYLEDVDEGRAFIDRARAVTGGTPIVVLKSGRTEAGARAAASHTGSLAGSDRAYDAGFRQAGVVRVDDVQSLFDFGRVLASQPPIDGNDVAVVTNAGGPGVIATDAIEDAGLELAEFGEETRSALSDALPQAASVENPVDVLGDADVERFGAAVEATLAADVDGVIVIACPTAVFEYVDLAERIGSLAADAGTPMAACLMGGEDAERAGERLGAAGVPNFFDPTRAVRSLGVLADHWAIRNRTYQAPTAFDDVDRERARAVLRETVDRASVARQETGRGASVEDAAARGAADREPGGQEAIALGVEAMDLLDAYGIPTPEGRVVDDPADAEARARELGGPAVLKVVSPDVSHKSDVGAVRVGVGVEDVREAYAELRSAVETHRPGAAIQGMLVQELVDPTDAVETIVGVNRDPQFGPLALFGLGGVFVEVLADTSVRVAPLSEPEAREMTEEIDAAAVLRGARGRAPVDVDAVVETIERVARLATDVPAIAELDVNPLVAWPGGVSAVDLRLSVDPGAL